MEKGRGWAWLNEEGAGRGAGGVAVGCGRGTATVAFTAAARAASRRKRSAELAPHLSFARAQLLDTHAVGVRREKMYKVDDHIACAVAGMTGARRRAARAAGLLCAAAAWRACPRARSSPTAEPSRRDALLTERAPLPPPSAHPPADANILINLCRLNAQRYYFAYQVPWGPY